MLSLILIVILIPVGAIILRLSFHVASRLAGRTSPGTEVIEEYSIRTNEEESDNPYRAPSVGAVAALPTPELTFSMACAVSLAQFLGLFLMSVTAELTGTPSMLGIAFILVFLGTASLLAERLSMTFRFGIMVAAIQFGIFAGLVALPFVMFLV